MRRHPAAALLTLFALTISACDDSGEPAPSSYFVQGTQSVLGSLTVNDIPFRIGSATVRYLDDGQTIAPGEAPAELVFYPGSVIAVRGTVSGDRSQGSAEEVLLRSVLRGPLQGRGESSIAVAGADVLLDARTAVIDANGAPTTIAGIAAGQRVEVHGFPEDGTRIRATLVRALNGTPAVSVRGWSRGIPIAGAFELSLTQGGGALLLVQTATLPPGGVPADALVSVGGDAVAAGAHPTLTASRVAVEAQILPRPGDRVLVEGIVLAGDQQQFVLGEHLVRTSSVTAYEGIPVGGNLASSIAKGTRLVVEGPFLDGVVIAQRVKVLDLTRLAGRIQPGSFAIGNPATFGVFTLSGSTVSLDASTRIVGPTGAPLTIVQLASLHSADLAGLPVVVHGYARADGGVQAQRIDVSTF